MTIDWIKPNNELLNNNNEHEKYTFVTNKTTGCCVAKSKFRFYEQMDMKQVIPYNKSTKKICS